MKSEQRSVYLELSNEINAQICLTCKYAESLGCCDGMECKHPLNHLFRHTGFDSEPEPGEDCWGFRPRIDTSMMADIAGIILSNGWDEWYVKFSNPPIVKGRSGS